MLSLTSNDMPNFTPATPEKVSGAQEKALNLWVGATSPLWAPFWLASAFGIGLWAVGQGFKRAQGAIGTVPPLGILPSTSSTTDVAGTVQSMVDDGVIAPMQAAGKAIADMTTAVTPSPDAIAEQIKTAGDEATTKAAELGQAATDTVDEATTRAVEQSEAQVDAVAEVAKDTGSLFAEGSVLVPEAAKSATAVAADTAVSAADIADDAGPALAQSPVVAAKAVKAATTVAADTAVATADGDRPLMRKPKKT